MQQPRSTNALAFHYHQADRDVDMVLERNDGSLVAIEVEAAASIRARDYR